MLKKILTFLGGKPADIFNDKGEVTHNLPKDMWDNWHKRYFDKNRADWRNHTGKKKSK